MKARRSNGDGAIDKVKRARKDGTIVETWRGRLSVGIDPRTLRPRRITLYADTRSELATKMARMKSDADRGILPSSERITVEVLLERWVDDVMAARVRATTLSLYRSLIRTHLLPAIGALRLDRLTAQDVAAVLSRMRESRRSERTQALALIILRSAIDQAVRWDLVPRNVARSVDAPRPQRKAMTALSLAQSQRFLRLARGTRFGALYTLALLAGLRRGELLGLQWADVDFERRTLSVVRSVVLLDGKPIIAEPKTSAGRRMVDVPATALRALREQQVTLFAAGLRSSPWVFPNEDGATMNPENLIRRSFRPLLARAIADAQREGLSFPSIRFHDLRHTAATLMLELGIPQKVVQERLGHASIVVTMDTYSHVSPTMQRDAAERIDGLFAAI